VHLPYWYPCTSSSYLDIHKWWQDGFITFYKRYGFQIAGTLPRFYTDARTVQAGPTPARRDSRSFAGAPCGFYGAGADMENAMVERGPLVRVGLE